MGVFNIIIVLVVFYMCLPYLRTQPWFAFGLSVFKEKVDYVSFIVGQVLHGVLLNFDISNSITPSSYITLGKRIIIGATIVVVALLCL